MTTGTLVRDVALYSVARLGLVVVLAVVILFGGKAIGVDVPLIVAALFAVLIALPLSLVLFAKLRKRVNWTSPQSTRSAEPTRPTCTPSSGVRIGGDGPFSTVGARGPGSTTPFV